MTLTGVSFSGGPMVSTRCPLCDKHADYVGASADGRQFQMAHNYPRTTTSYLPAPDGHMWAVSV